MWNFKEGVEFEHLNKLTVPACKFAEASQLQQYYSMISFNVTVFKLTLRDVLLKERISLALCAINFFF